MLSPGESMLEEPELVELIDEEPEDIPLPPANLGKKIVVQVVVVACLKVATGLAIRALVKSIRDFEVLYPENFDRVNWRV